MTDSPRPGTGLFELLENNTHAGLESLMAMLATSGRWFVHGEQVMFEYMDTLKEFKGKQDQTRTLVSNLTIPVLDLNASQVPLTRLNRTGLPAIIGEHILLNAPHSLPRIERYVNLPAVKIVKDHLEPCPPGYDFATGVYYQGVNPDLNGTSINSEHIMKWLTGLCFGNDYHMANAIGITAACFARSVLYEFPSIFIDANVQSSGKTKLAKAIGTVLLGATPDTLSYTGEQDELERRLSPFAGRPGPNFMLIDNVMRKGKSSSVASMMLSRSLDGMTLGIRALYKGQAEIQAPVFVLTMNDTTVHSDLQDKSVRIRLERRSREPNAELTPDPHRYALEHRKELVKEFMTLLNGLPVHSNNHDTRCYLFNSIVYGVADRLGLKASLHSRDVACPSDIVSELVFFTQENDTHAELGREFDLQRLVDQVAARPDDYKELNRFLRQCQRPHKQRGKELGKHLFHNAARPCLFEDAMYKLDVDAQFEKATLQKISPSA